MTRKRVRDIKDFGVFRHLTHIDKICCPNLARCEFYKGKKSLAFVERGERVAPRLGKLAEVIP